MSEWSHVGKPKKVLFIGPLPEPMTGQSLACQVFLDGLRTRAIVDVIDINKKILKSGVDSVGRIGEVLSYALAAFRKRRGRDVVYFTIAESVAGTLKDMLIYLACFSQLRRMVVHLHGGAGMRHLLSDSHPLLRRANAFFLRRMGGVIVLGSRLVPVYQDIVPSDRIFVIPNFAGDELFLSPELVASKFRSSTPLRVLFLSNLIPGKGHMELVEAIAALTPEERELLAVDFAGGFEADKDRDVFLARIAAIPQIRYHGSVRGEAKRRLFADAHLFCLPTYYPYEGQPISILEAYASGCAVLTTDHSGIFDVFEPGKNGLDVEKGSAVAILAALRRVLENPGALLQYAQRNREDAERLYTIAIYNRNLFRVIDAVGSDD